MEIKTENKPTQEARKNPFPIFVEKKAQEVKRINLPIGIEYKDISSDEETISDGSKEVRSFFISEETYKSISSNIHFSCFDFHYGKYLLPSFINKALSIYSVDEVLNKVKKKQDISGDIVQIDNIYRNVLKLKESK